MPTLNELLVKAVTENKKCALETLLSQGAGPNTIFSDENYSVLERAAAYGHLKIAQILLEKGAEVNHIDANGFTALHWTIFTAPPQQLSKMLELLMSHGAICQPSLYALAEKMGNLHLLDAAKEKVEMSAKTDSSVPSPIFQEKNTKKRNHVSTSDVLSVESSRMGLSVSVAVVQTETQSTATHPPLNHLNNNEEDVTQITVKRGRRETTEDNSLSPAFDSERGVNVASHIEDKENDNIFIKVLEQQEKIIQQQQMLYQTMQQQQQIQKQAFDNLANEVYQLRQLVSLSSNQQKLQPSPQTSQPIYQFTPTPSIPSLFETTIPMALVPIATSLTRGQASVKSAPLLGQYGIYPQLGARDDTSIPLDVNNNNQNNNHDVIPPSPLYSNLVLQ